MAESRRVNTEVVASTKWLRLASLTYRDPHNTERKWDMVQRATKAGAIDGVDVCAVVKTPNKPDQLILELQYRPPMDALSLEFPSGLIDANEKPEEAALRELKEETGYVGKVTSVSPIFSMEPGMSDEVCVLATVEVDATLPENQHPVTELEDSEFIEVIMAPLDNLLEFILELIKTRKCVPDAKLYTYALGLSLARRNN